MGYPTSNSARNDLGSILNLIGCIQAFIFVTLSMVYMSHKIETEE